MLILLLLLHFLSGILGINLVNFDVPTNVALGDPVWLNCSYELEESEELYMIRWYKNRSEFYRYTPDEYPSTMFFDVQGVYANFTSTYEGYVYLYKTNEFSAGSYSCEVSANAPSFSTMRRKGDLFIDGPTTMSSNDLAASTEPMPITAEPESNELIEKTIKKLNFKLSENEHFGLSISRSLDKMPEEKASEIKIKIMQILHAIRFRKNNFIDL